MANAYRYRLIGPTPSDGSDPIVYGNLEPPPSKTREFLDNWIQWIHRLYAYIGGIYDLIDANQTIADWTALTLNAVDGWVDAGTDPAYYKDRDRVYLKGKLSAGTTGTTAFTLPVGYRPSEDLYFLIHQTGAVAGAELNVKTDGSVDIYYTAANVNINNISFRV